MMLIPLIGLIVGVAIGIVIPVEFPQVYSAYVAIGILACIDSVLGGIRANLNDKFHLHIFLSGFFGNAVLAIMLTWLGNKLNIQLSIAAIIVYGSRLFENFAFLRRFLLNKTEKRDRME